MMKSFIHGILMVAVMASAVSMSAQTAGQAQPAGQSPAAGQAQTADQAQPAVPAQTADEIVGKYVAAIGGKDAISKVKSMYLETSVQVMGNESPSTTTIVDGVGYKTETDLNGAKIVQCYTDKGGWTVNPMAGQNDPTAMPDEVYNLGKAQINVGGALYDYAAKGSKVELVGKDGGAYKVKLTTKENVETTYLIDSNTYLVKTAVSKGKMQDQDVDITMQYSNYRKTDLGYVIPYAVDLDFGGQFQLGIAVKKVELNKTIDPAVFAMPK
jgi:hypothetical protein